MGKRAESNKRQLGRMDEFLIIILVMTAIIYSFAGLIRYKTPALLLSIGFLALAYLHYSISKAAYERRRLF